MPKLFLSGSLGSSSHRSRIYDLTTCRLLSLHASYLNVARQWFTEFAQKRDCSSIEIMFDSGAFSAWSKGEPDIDVKKLLSTYKQALRSCQPLFKDVWFISLDKIPGAPGRTANSEEIAEAIRISDVNHHILAEELGNLVLPVWHQSESLDRLAEVKELNKEYICVSPRNDLREVQRREWSQRAHLHTRGVRTHGLAATGGEMLLNVPWTSTDSASWVQIAAYGMVLVPEGGSIRTIAVSEHNGERRSWGRHGDTAGEEARFLLDRTAGEVGVSREELRTKSGARELFNVYVMSQLASQGFRPVPVQTTLLEL